MKPEALLKWLTNRADSESSLPEKERNDGSDLPDENGDREAADQPNQPEGGQPLRQYRTISEEEIFS